MKLLQYPRHAHHKNLESIQRMCSVCSIEYEATDDRNRVNTVEYDILWLPSLWISPDELPSTVKILYGPHFFVFPSGPVCGERNVEWETRACFNTLSTWVKTLYMEFSPSFTIPLCVFPMGINSALQDCKEISKQLDCVVYFKNRISHQYQYAINLLRERQLHFKVFQYGSYSNDEYIETIKTAKFVLWIGCHESQGFALQECLAMNIPVLLWNVTSMYDETDSNGHVIYSSYYGSKKLLATSATTWDSTCGLECTEMHELKPTLYRMLEEWKSFCPREFILSELSDKVCMERILKHFNLSIDLKN